MQTNSSDSSPQRRAAVIVAWIVTLLVSTLPTILLNELGGGAPGWLFWAKIVFIALMLVLTFFWKAIKPLAAYFIVILVLFLAEWALQSYLGETALWKSWFSSAAFTSSMLGMQILRFGVAMIMVAAMLVIKKRRSAFFLVKGDLSAKAEPIPLLMNKPEPWSKLGPNLALFISLGTLAFLVVASRPSLNVLAQALPFLPFVLLFAAMNAFSEEMNYKASFLSVLHEVVGKDQSLLLMAAFFGIGHYYGIPYGIVGVLMAGFLGWLLGKSMLETRGFVWAWFIHFLQDVLIFSFMAIGSIAAGGG
jgi:hypothetical protein